MHRTGVLAAIALAAALLAPGLGTTLADAPAAERLVVRFAGDTPGLVPGEGFLGARVVRVAPALGAALVEAPDGPAFRAAAAGDPRVAGVERDAMGVRAADHGLQPPAFVDLPGVPGAPSTGLAAAPNDAYYATQYGVPQVRLHEAWLEAGTGAPGVALCVTDSGLRLGHEELRGGRFRGGHDFFNGDPDITAGYYHGNFVTAIATGNRDNGAGIAGAATMPFYHAQMLGANGHGNWFALAEAIAWCADRPDERLVISMSIVGTFDPGEEEQRRLVHDAVRHAAAKGRLLVASAGNANSVSPLCLDCVLYPAAFPEVVAVTSTSPGHAPSWWSSFGPEAEVAAPGDVILSASSGSDAEYTVFSGTSFSAPLVAGTAALVWSQHPALTAEQLRARLRDTARDLGTPGHDVLHGHGELDALCLLHGTAPCLV